MTDRLPAFDTELFVSSWRLGRSNHMVGAFDRYHDLFDDSSLVAAVKAHVPIKAGFIDEQGEHAEIRIGSDEIERMLAAGMTVCASQLQGVNTRLGELCRALARALLVVDEFNVSCYTSPPGKGFGMHFDDRTAWILQLSGSKQWTFSVTPATDSPTRPVVLRNGVSPVGLFDPVTFDSAVLKPGDLLYLPAGAWHAGQAIETSTALTLSWKRKGRQARVRRLFDVMQAAGRRNLTHRRGWKGSGQLATFPPEAAGHALLSVRLYP
jgi:hypothetical protein